MGMTPNFIDLRVRFIPRQGPRGSISSDSHTLPTSMSDLVPTRGIEWEWIWDRNGDSTGPYVGAASVVLSGVRVDGGPMGIAGVVPGEAFDEIRGGHLILCQNSGLTSDLGHSSVVPGD
jgi:hypothetical protein